jgi:hypothetical protein
MKDRREWYREYGKQRMRKIRAGVPNVAPIDHDLLQLEWRDIPEFPGYMASQCGKIMSVKRSLMRSNGDAYTIPARILKPSLGTDKRLSVGLLINKKLIRRPIARLVYMAWIGPIPAGMDIDHIDEARLNNHVTNLQPLTRQENGEKYRRHQIAVKASKDCLHK